MSNIIHVIFALFVVVSATSTKGPSRSRSDRSPPENRSYKIIDNVGLQAQTFHPRNNFRSDVPQYTDIDKELREVFIDTRITTLGNALKNLDTIVKINRQEGKMQPIYPADMPFPCLLNNTRSPTLPTSVERLRPGDIDIISAIGDSLSAGNAILSTSGWDMLNEFRGIAFSGGGMEDWRTYITLPNILKVFNPDLYGYATANTLVVNHQKSHLHIAEPMIMSRDLVYQARVLIDLMRHDPKVDMEKHWKLLTVYVGNNDLCSDICLWKDPQAVINQHAKDLQKAFRMLRDNVPRLVINLIVAPNIVSIMKDMNHLASSCYMLHRIACSCLVSDRLTKAQRQQRQEIILRWQEVDMAVARLPEFQREDFAIIAHPFMTKMTTPRFPDGSVDWRVFAHDCFHFSQVANAMMANLLWNSMMLPEAKRPRPSRLLKPLKYFRCPTEEQPYLVVRPSL